MPSLAVPIATLCLLVSGCGFMMIGPPAEKMDLTSQNDAEENLKAIRAMLADQQTRSAPSSDKPFDEPLTPLPPSESKAMSEPQSSVDLVTPFSVSSTGSINPPTKIPWTPPSISSPGPPDRLFQPTTLWLL